MHCNKREKYVKHEATYALLGHAFLAFVLSPFGVLGPSLISFSAQLAQIKLQRCENYSELRNLPRFSPAESGQLLAKLLSAIFSSFMHLALQAAVMRLTGSGVPPNAPQYSWINPLHSISLDVTYADTLLASQPLSQPSLAAFLALSWAESLGWPPLLLLSYPLSFLLHLSAFSHSLSSS
jgi:hypothetical protein